MSASNKPIILVDGSSYLYRAFHALPPLTNSKNFPTGAAYGVINMLKKLIADYQPTHMAVIFDAKGKTFRDELYKEYKATRKAMPEELAQQIKPIHDIIKAMGLPLIEISGVEADDVIGTYAAIATKEKKDVLISTGDKDLAQLVNKNITLINTMNNKIMDEAGVTEKFGVKPKQIIDYLTLVGDSSDNIPGVDKVGPKTATKWLAEHNTLDAIVANADNVKGKIGENLRKALNHLPLSKQLVTIKLDVDITKKLDELTIQDANKDKLLELFKDMEFKSWTKELIDEKQLVNKVESNYELVNTEKQFNVWLDKIKKAKLFAFDTETTSLDSMSAKIVGVSVAVKPGEAAYIPLAHTDDSVKQLDKEKTLAALKPILEDKTLLKVGQNLKYDMEVLQNEGINLQGVSFDTMLESYVLDSAGNRHDMDSMALKYLGHRTITFEDVAGKGAKQITFDEVSIDKATSYAAEDADITLQLHETLWPKLSKEKGLKYVFEKLEMPLVPVLATIETNGVLIDPEKLIKQGKELQKRIKELEQEAYTLAGEEFNLNSPKQLQELLFTKLNLPILQKTPKGQPSTAESVLQELAFDYDLPKIIIEFRSLSKLMSTYTNRLVEQINPKTKRIHTSYNQTVTATGRLSSSEPNLQNIPIRSKEGRRIREAFVAPEGYTLFSADYSQIELRLMAHISEDPSLLKAFSNGHDVHKATAAEVWGVPFDEVTSEMRRDAKAINFGLLYGMSAFGLTKQLGIDRKAAQAYIDKYFQRYPNVKKYMEDTKVQAREKGYVETLWGRRLYLPEINASKIMRQKAAERTAINAPLQGSAADIIKMAMIDIQNWLEKDKIDAKMIMQVHDELVFEVKKEILTAFQEKIEHYMCDVVKLKIPIKVSVGSGDDWDAASDH